MVQRMPYDYTMVLWYVNGCQAPDFDLKSQKIALQFRRANEILNYYQALGYDCDLIELCDQVKSIVEVD